MVVYQNLRDVWYLFSAKIFRFHTVSCPHWDSNPQPRAYHKCTHVITCARFCLKENVATDEGNGRNET